MSYPFAFRTPAGEAAFLAAYDAALKRWPVLHDELEICDPTEAVARARRLNPHFEGSIVPGCGHDMCFSQHRIVHTRVREFLAPSVAFLLESS
jgi:pimeloyl-ACP methyl ester carboxylesterase